MSDTWTLQDEAVDPYLQVCRLAAQSSDYFNTFKSHPAYRHVLEHVSEDEQEAETIINMSEENDDEFNEVQINK